MKTSFSVSMLALAAAAAFAGNTVPTISGDYLEVRSCDVYTGSCFANSEMNLAGKEGMMFWSVREGTWNGTKLDGLAVMAVVKADGTLGNLKYQPRSGNARSNSPQTRPPEQHGHWRPRTPHTQQESPRPL